MICKLIKKNSKSILAIVVISFLLALLVVIIFGNTKDPEVYEHGLIANNLLVNGVYGFNHDYSSYLDERIKSFRQPTVHSGAYIPPLNPILIYSIFRLFGNSSNGYIAFYAVNSLLYSLAIAVVYLIAIIVTDRRSAILTIIIAISYLPALYSVITFSGGSLYHFLTLLSILLAVVSISEKSAKHVICLGIAIGTTSLVRSEFLLFGVLLLLVIFYLNKDNRKSVMLSMLLVVVVVSPWSVRNYIIFDKLVPIISHPWHEVWRGNNSMATGSEIAIHGKKMWLRRNTNPALIKELDNIPYDSKFEIRSDEIFKRESLNFVTTHPAKFMELVIKRIANLWGYDIRSPRVTAIYIAGSLLAQITIGLGLILSILKLIKKGKGIWIDESVQTILPLILFALFQTILIGVVNFELRYQVYLMVSILPLSSIPLNRLLSKIT